MPAHCFAFASSASRSFSTSGNSFTIASAAAMCIAVGNVSLDDCDMLTWSFGWTGFFEPISPPASSIARFEITSLTFMFVCVPEPVCHTRSGKCSNSLPSITSSAAWVISFVFSSSSLPRSRLTSAAAFLSCAIARMISRGMTSRGVESSPMSKWMSERADWAP